MAKDVDLAGRHCATRSTNCKDSNRRKKLIQTVKMVNGANKSKTICTFVFNFNTFCHILWSDGNCIYRYFGHQTVQKRKELVKWISNVISECSGLSLLSTKRRTVKKKRKLYTGQFFDKESIICWFFVMSCTAVTLRQWIVWT